MFKHKKKVPLRLLRATTMSTGIVALKYEPTWPAASCVKQ